MRCSAPVNADFADFDFICQRERDLPSEAIVGAGLAPARLNRGCRQQARNCRSLRLCVSLEAAGRSEYAARSLLLGTIRSRECKADRHTVAGYAIALGPDAPAVRLDDVSGDRQAQAGSTTGARTVSPEETLENARQVVARDTGTVVGHFDHDVAAEPTRAHPNVSLRRRELDRIVQQIAQRPSDEFSIGQHGQSGRNLGG